MNPQTIAPAVETPTAGVSVRIDKRLCGEGIPDREVIERGPGTARGATGGHLLSSTFATNRAREEVVPMRNPNRGGRATVARPGETQGEGNPGRKRSSGQQRS